MDEILERLENLQRLIECQGINAKDVLNFNEACQYLKLSQSHLYKMTSAGSIPHYKPNGKKLYFKRSELESWLLGNRNPIQIEPNGSKLNKRDKKVGIKIFIQLLIKMVDWLLAIFL